MIIRKDAVPFQRASRESFGVSDTAALSDAGGLQQYGAYLQILQPGARSSNRHWHEKEDEFLYVLSGEVTVTENEAVETLHPGDAACWAAGVPTAHYVSNHSSAPCSYLIVGTRADQDVCHYPDTGRTLHSEGKEWRLLEADGKIYKTGSF